MIKTFGLWLDENLNEAKYIADLFHFTYIDTLVEILNSNKLIASVDSDDTNWLSLTRDKNFNKYKEHRRGSCRIRLDAELLSEKYKIQPYQYPYKYAGDEMEERINVKEIFNIKKYIKDITIFPKLFFENAIKVNEMIIKSFQEYLKKDKIETEDIISYIKKLTDKINIKLIVE